MATLRKKDVKFCPLCGGPAEIARDQFSHCNTCSKLFTVEVAAGLVKPSPTGLTFHRECGKKVKHLTPESALEHAKQLPELPNRIHARLTVYKCRFGDENHWHVGHMAGRSKRNPIMYFKVKDMLVYEGDPSKWTPLTYLPSPQS